MIAPLYIYTIAMNVVIIGGIVALLSITAHYFITKNN